MTQRRQPYHAQQSQHKQYRKRKKPFRPIRTFFKIVTSMVLAFLFLSGGAVFAYYKMTGESPFGGYVGTKGSDINLIDAMLQKDIQLNVAVFGTDKDGMRTDVMFVVHYDSATESMDLLSVPRDTRVSICSEVIDSYEKYGHSYNSVTKLNAIHSYSAGDECCENTVLQIEDLLGIHIDHYVKVDIEAFRKIVDTVGGVEVDVPQDMNYEDPTQDLYIHLQAGLQTLNGEQAEQLVRFRSYPTGDEGRIEVQQLFLKALAEKVLNSQSILSNLPDYISIIYKDVETDLSMTDAIKYANYIEKINLSNITMQTIPGTGQYVGGVSYFIHDPEETTALVDQIFYTQRTTTQNTTTTNDSKSLTIQVANGGTINGLAGTYTERLQQEGYQLTSPVNFEGTQTSYTRIQTRTDGMGTDLIPYFNDAQIEVYDMLPEGIDIRIVLGTGEE